ncbi:MAG: hypothetical protein OD816_000160 [Thermodesulfobacterium sp.]|uniref:Iron hydrogenase small subunit domain-containing protein n=1 Tax=Candidatus Thermodesulfobacterium syntrophicum TaxID=3060442 RepID=A0AAE3P2Y3_9BACT|nr:hypothetical protein [Candidatus Thermodesulfobacterium syntrophicum]
MRKEISRRTFLKTAGITAVALTVTDLLPLSEKLNKKLFAYQPRIITNFFETPVGKARRLLIRKRQLGQYADDVIMREEYGIAVSHQNPMIKKFYKNFAKHPLSEVSEALLHTYYKSRK